MAIEPKYVGKRYKSLVRCSTDGQADTSIPDQISLLGKWADDREMISAGTEILDGVRGTVPFIRTEVPRLLEEAKRGEFDILLVQDLWRLTRSGLRHGFMLEYMFRQAGVEIVSASDNFPPGPAGDFYRTFKYQAGLEHVRKLSHDVDRGMMSKILAGHLPHSAVPPYGCDRLYIGLDGNPRHRIRNFADRTQVKLAPDSDEVLTTYGPKHKDHYIKQPDEKIVYVLGERRAVECVRHIFNRRYRDNWGAPRIARELKELGMPSPTGKEWNASTVGSVCLNTTYTGMGLACRTSCALFYRRAPRQPVEVELELSSLQSAHPPLLNRPKNDWVPVLYPELEGFLGADIRLKVQLEQMEKWEWLSQKGRKKRGGDKHLDSLYLLKNILKCKQGHSMRGRTSVGPIKTRRYYAVVKGLSFCHQHKGLSRHIPAEPLEAIAVSKLQEVLLACPDLRNRIVHHVKNLMSERSHDAALHEALIKERDEVKRELQFIVTHLGDLGQDAVKERASQLERKLRTLNDQINRETGDQQCSSDIEKIAENIVKQIGALQKQNGSSPSNAIRRLLEIMVSSMVVDLETRDVEIEFSIPCWAFKKDVRLDSNTVSNIGIEANRKQSLKLGVFKDSVPHTWFRNLNFSKKKVS